MLGEDRFLTTKVREQDTSSKFTQGMHNPTPLLMAHSMEAHTTDILEPDIPPATQVSQTDTSAVLHLQEERLLLSQDYRKLEEWHQEYQEE